jgi:uncharacterized protein
MEQNLISKFAGAFEAYPEILSAYLFGSTATGHARTGSDVDIAVRLVAGLCAEERFQIRLGLMDRLEQRVDRSVDVVVMNDASLIMLNQIFSSGIRLFIRDPDDEERLKILKQKEFFDFRYYLDRDFEQMRVFFGASRHDSE